MDIAGRCRDAERIADLFVVMTAGAAIIWLAVVGLSFYASRWRTREHPDRYRRDSGVAVRSFDDPALRTPRVGVHLVGDDGANTPPAHALAARGIVRNVAGYTLYGDYSEPNPPARLVEAVARGDVDVAVVWGPLAGYFARRQAVPLQVVPVSPEIDLPFLPFVFDISMGVRREDAALAAELDGILERRAAGIDALLDEFGIPYVRRVRRARSSDGRR